MSNFTTAKQVIDALTKALRIDAAAYVRELNSNPVVSRSHLTLRNLYLNFGKDKTDTEVARLFEAARQRRDAVHNQQWECPCGWAGHEDELVSHCEFRGSQEEPPEYSATCPDCGDDWEGMSEPVMCKSCEDVRVKDDGDMCSECYTCMMEDRADGARDDAMMRS